MKDNNRLKLPHGLVVHIRPILSTDVNERHEFFVKLSLAQTGIVHTIDETEVHTHETHDQIHDFLRNRRGLWLVALTTNHKIIGEVDITVKNLQRIKHNGLLTIGVLPEYQGQGLGSRLLEQALAWASEHHLLRIELSVFAKNQRARAIYEKFGFVIEGVRANFLHHEDGSFEDDIMMAKYF